MREIRWCDTHADWAADHLGGVPEDESRCRWSRFVNSEKPCDIHKVLHIRESERATWDGVHGWWCHGAVNPCDLGPEHEQAFTAGVTTG